VSPAPTPPRSHRPSPKDLEFSIGHLPFSITLKIPLQVFKISKFKIKNISPPTSKILNTNGKWNLENGKYFDAIILIDIKIRLQYDYIMQGYNRESGRKTLVFVGIVIALIVLFSVLSLMMLGKSNN
jgi:hypothetical protein